jgi:chemotaxis protein methyltransferase WspC
MTAGSTHDHRRTDKPSSVARSVSTLDDAQRLADQGRFDEAAARCEEHLKAHGPSAAGFYLLGLVRDANGRDAEAESCYRKALYLDPSHAETLVHLALLLDRRGDQAAAQRLRERARRAETDALR